MKAFAATHFKGDCIDGRMFKPINVAMNKLHVTEMENHYVAAVTKKSAIEREHTVIIPQYESMGSRFGTCTCCNPKTEGISFASTWWP